MAHGFAIRSVLAALALALLAWGRPAPAAAEELPVDLELVLAVDISGSVDEEEAQLQRNGYVRALVDPEVVRAIQSGILGRIAVTYVEWAGADHQNIVLPWALIDGPAAARKFSDALAGVPPLSGRFTSISAAIDFSVPLFAKNGFEGTRRVIDISGDGPNNRGRLVTEARDEAIRQGVTVNGLPIVNDRPNFFGPPSPDLDLYYRDCVIGGPGALMVVAEDFKSFARAIRRKLILEIAGISPAPRKTGARVILAASDRTAPPCDIGEKLRRSRFLDRF